MKQKRKASFFLGLILIVSMLVALGGVPAVSKAVTTTTLSLQDQITSLQNQILIQKLLALIAQLQAQLQQLIANKTITTVQCGWCGNSCINWAGKDRSSTACADVMPPAGSSCQNINGTCQITNNATKYSCSTAMGTISSNNYTGCIPSNNGTFNSLAECQNSCPVTTACITEGKSISVTPVGFTQKCCSGLVLCPPPSGIVGSMGTCQKTCTTPSSCTDSDNGKNYNVKGVVTYQGQTYTDQCVEERIIGCIPTTTNSCSPSQSTSFLQEYYCEDGVMKNEGHACGSGYTCQDGACKAATVVTTKPLALCTDSDNGQNYNVKGTTTYNGSTVPDICGKDANVGGTPQTLNSLQEFYCGSNGQRYVDFYECPNGCENGACKTQPVCNLTSSFSTGPVTGDINTIYPYAIAPIGGTQPYTYSWSTDNLWYTGDLTVITNFLATHGGVWYKWTTPGIKTVSVTVTDAKGCSVGVSRDVTITAPQTCTDSDGGTNYNVKGTTTGMAGNNVLTTDTDSCNGNTLIEWFCSGAYRTNTNYVCPGGCYNGACLSVPPTTIPAAAPTINSATIDGKTIASTNPPTYLAPNVSHTIAVNATNATSYKYYVMYKSTAAGNVSGWISLGGNTGSAASFIPNCSGSTCSFTVPASETVLVWVEAVNGSQVTSLGFWYTYTSASSTATGCSWCGNTCVLSSLASAGTKCADVMPPTGSTCTLVNGVCTASNGGVVEGVETHIFSENLGYGMENEDVRALQSILAAKGYFSSIISGYFGWQTEEAVKVFQSANNLPATGLVGPLTRELLNK